MMEPVSSIEVLEHFPDYHQGIYYADDGTPWGHVVNGCYANISAWTGAFCTLIKCEMATTAEGSRTE